MTLIDRPAAIWRQFHIGMRVTVREPQDAYYSGYAGRPSCAFEPGMVGTIASVDNPYVRRSRGRSESFACVDFLYPTLAQSGEGFEWRAGVDPKNLVALDPRPRSRRPGILFLIDTPSDSCLLPYTALDRSVLRASGCGAGDGIYGTAALQRLRGDLAELGYNIEVIPARDPLPGVARPGLIPVNGGPVPSTPATPRNDQTPWTR
jgi:hypothetical protein